MGTDYTVEYRDNVSVGTAKAIISGIGNYTGNVERAFTIQGDIAKASVTLEKTSYTYDGTAKTPSVTVKLDGKTLALNTDYTVSYNNNSNFALE